MTVYLTQNSATWAYVHQPLAESSVPYWIRHGWQRISAAGGNAGGAEWARVGASRVRVATQVDKAVASEGAPNWVFTDNGADSWINTTLGGVPTKYVDPSTTGNFATLTITSGTRDLDVRIYRTGISGYMQFKIDGSTALCNGEDLDASAKYNAFKSGGNAPITLKVARDLPAGEHTLTITATYEDGDPPNGRYRIDIANAYLYADAVPSATSTDYDVTAVLKATTSDEFAMNMKKDGSGGGGGFIHGYAHSSLGSGPTEDGFSAPNYDFGAGDVWAGMSPGEVQSGTTLTFTNTSTSYEDGTADPLGTMTRVFTYSGSTFTRSMSWEATAALDATSSTMYTFMQDHTLSTACALGELYVLTSGTATAGPLGPISRIRTWDDEVLVDTEAQVSAGDSTPVTSKSFYITNTQKAYMGVANIGQQSIGWTTEGYAVTKFTAKIPTYGGKTVIVPASYSGAAADWMQSTIVKAVEGVPVAIDVASGAVSGTIFTSSLDSARGLGYTTSRTAGDYTPETGAAGGDWGGLIALGTATITNVESQYAEDGISGGATAYVYNSIADNYSISGIIATNVFGNIDDGSQEVNANSIQTPNGNCDVGKGTPLGRPEVGGSDIYGRPKLRVDADGIGPPNPQRRRDRSNLLKPVVQMGIEIGT
jgi:hypothetical protein